MEAAQRMTDVSHQQPRRASFGHGHEPPAGREPNGQRVVALLAEQRHLANTALRDAQSCLEANGYLVQVVAPAAGDLFDSPAEAPRWDAVLSRGRNVAALSILAAAANLGVLTINTPKSIELVRNKIAMQSLLARHQMPLPRAWFAVEPATFRQVPNEYFPLIVKPFDGDGSAGLWFLGEPADCELIPAPATEKVLYIAQEYLPTDGWDIKLYGIGSQVWAVRKPSPVTFPTAGPALMRPAERAELFPIDPRLRDIALTCGRACEMELWGVDVALTPSGPFVIEVNDFPTYSAVPNAGELIAQHAMSLVELDLLMRRAGQAHMLSIVRQPS